MLTLIISGTSRNGSQQIFSHLLVRTFFGLVSQPTKRQYWLTYNPAIPLLGIYPEKTIIQKESCTTMFIAALFTIARTWKQPKCPSTDEWVKKMWHIHTMECYSDIKKIRNWVICIEGDGPRVCHTE